MQYQAMRVAHIFWSLGYGGIETMLVNIANEQAFFGEDVSIIIINDLVEEELIAMVSPDVRLIRINRPKGEKKLSFVIKLNRALDAISPNIIHLHEGVLYNYLMRRWRTNNKCRICCTLHDMPKGICGMSWKLGRLVQNLVFHKGGLVMNLNRMDKVFSISNAVSFALKEKYGVNSLVISNGINTESFCQRKIIMPSGVFKIVQVSRLNHEKKGQDLLLNALYTLKTRGINCHVAFIGDGESMGFLVEMVEKLSLEGNVTFLGAKPQDYLKTHLADYDLFVQPSRYEGFGLTVAEAMAANVPVLVSSGQGPAEIIENERYGWIFKSGDVESLVNKIDSLMTNYEECLRKIPSARNHVQQMYDVSVTAQKYIDAYKALFL